MGKKENMRVESDEVNWLTSLVAGAASGGLTFLIEAMSDDSYWVEDEDGNIVADGFKSRSEAKEWIERAR